MSALAEPVTTTNVPRGKWVGIFVLVGRLALAAVFLFAAYAKMRPQVSMSWSLTSIETSLSMFAMQVDSYQMLSPAQAIRIAHLLPPFELFLGLWLLSGIVVRFSCLLTTLVLTGFFSLMIRTYALGLSINCGCFGSSEQVGPRKIIEDGSFFAFSLALTVAAFWLNRIKTRRAALSSTTVPSVIASQESR
jgi:uncharacterized membrane protein YphA (DoxX/SURF4 family)